MTNSLILYRLDIDNIFDFHFMEDFTTVALAKEEYNIGVSSLKYEDEDHFYSFSENRVYTKEELFEKFNVKKIV